MIIECPKCGFSGRIPRYALDSPYNARCPKCRVRFELQSLLVEPGLGSPADSDLHGGDDHGMEGPGSDPGASSYELKAITRIFADDEDDASDGEAWSQVDAVDEGAGSPLDRTDSPSGPARALANPRPIPDGGFARFGRTSQDPWYSRVLQVWGVVFLVWAALILARNLQLMFASGEGSIVRGDQVATMVSVLLLVPGAAVLFLLVDLGRYLRGQLPAPAAPKTAADGTRPPEPARAPVRRSPWRAPRPAASIGPNG